MPPSRFHFGVLSLLFAFPQTVLGSLRHTLAPAIEYIFVSQPAQHTVSVTEVNALTRKVLHESRPLITGLREPSGLAVDPSRHRLYVADPKSHKVFIYELDHDDNGLHVNSGKHFVTVRDMAPRWVAVDERGNLFCTDEAHSVIAEISADELSRVYSEGKAKDDGKATVQFHTLYSGKEVGEVNRPGGIAVEGNHVYWGNRARGRPSGSLVSAPEDPQKQLQLSMIPEIRTLTKNVDKVFGVCASPSLVFYTGGKRSVFGVQQESQHPKVYETINLKSYSLTRGCVWDGDGTVFVADQGSDFVWSFPSSTHNIGRVQPSKVFGIKDPFGIAVFRPRTRTGTIGFLDVGSSAMHLMKGCAFQARLALSMLVLSLFCGRDALL